MLNGEKPVTGVKILEEIQMLQLELEYNSSLRKRTDTLLRLVVQELTLEALTMEKWIWMLRPLMEGRNDSEERIIRARMKPTLEDLDLAYNAAQKTKYDRIPMGLVGTAKQIMQTADNYRRIYKDVQKVEIGTQTDPDQKAFSSAQDNDDGEFHSMDSTDSLENYFQEEHVTDDESSFWP